VVALYPRCTDFSGDMVGPTLILIGEKDDWTPAQEGRDMIAGRSGIGLARPAAYHSFDLPDLFIDRVRVFGHWLAYDDAAKRIHLDRLENSCTKRSRWRRQGDMNGPHAPESCPFRVQSLTNRSTLTCPKADTA